MKIHNTLTNVVGRTKTERLVSRDLWEREVLPAAKALLKTNSKSHKALIGKWVVSLIGNDSHIDVTPPVGVSFHVGSKQINGLE